MRSHRFGRKIKLPATIAIKRQIIMLMALDETKKTEAHIVEQCFARQLTRRLERYPNMDSLDVYEANPGSPEAVCLGCICPPIQRGPRFTVHERCPLHGFETVRPLFQVRPLDQIAGP